MGYPGGQVDVAGLARVASNVTQAGEAFDKAFSARVDVLAPGSVLAGWATGTALAGATEAWAVYGRSLAGQIRSFGADLGTAANNYERADSAAAGRVAGAGTSPGHGTGRYGRAWE